MKNSLKLHIKSNNMLISFRVSNFLSFNDEIEFSMLAGQPRLLPTHVIHLGEGRNRIDILKTAIICGANASGKSNLIKAMDFARNVIVAGVKSEVTHNKHFRLDLTNADKPSKFEFEFKIDHKIYSYGFSVHLGSQKFQSEWLTEVGKTTDKPIFEREILDNGKSKFNFNLKLTGKAKTRFEVYQEDVLETQLFLNTLKDKYVRDDASTTLFGDVLAWFLSLNIIFNNTKLNHVALQNLAGDDKKEYIDTLRLLDARISDIQNKELDLDGLLTSKADNYGKLSGNSEDVLMVRDSIVGYGKNRIYLTNNQNSVKPMKTVFYQSNENVEFELEELSDGARRLLDIVPILIGVKKPKSIFIVDEIDRSLHPELSRKLIEIFHANTEGVESQLIMTTHESSLLDLDLLRRDEIWFSEKNEKGESHLFSLEEFKPRHDVELRKAYLLGRFGAVPFVSDVKSLDSAEIKPVKKI